MVIDLKGLWHFRARLFLIRATCFIHNPMCVHLLSKHAQHLLTSRQCSVRIQLQMGELRCGLGNKRPLEMFKLTQNQLGLLPVAGVYIKCLFQDFRGLF